MNQKTGNVLFSYNQTSVKKESAVVRDLKKVPSIYEENELWLQRQLEYKKNNASIIKTRSQVDYKYLLVLNAEFQRSLKNPFFWKFWEYSQEIIYRKICFSKKRLCRKCFWRFFWKYFYQLFFRTPVSRSFHFLKLL